MSVRVHPHRPSVSRLGVAAISVLLLPSAAALPKADGGGVRPRPGMLLVAAPDLPDPRFRESVVLLFAYGPEGAAGVIVNKPGSMRLAELVPPFADVDRIGHVVFFGGPVAIDGITFLMRGAPPQPGESLEVFGGVHFSASADTLRAALEEKRGTRELRLFAGYSGWGRGQLEREIERGDWRLVEAEPPLVFAQDPRSVWRSLIEKLAERIPV